MSAIFGLQVPACYANHFAESITWSDGVSGAATSDQKWIITSPTSDFIPMPELGIVNLSLGPDAHFGSADPVLHPQLLQEDTRFPWIVAIQRVNESHSRAVLWHVLTDADVDPSTAENIFTIKSELQSRFTGPRDEIDNFVRQHEAKYDTNQELRWLHNSMTFAYNRLQFPGSFRDLARQAACFRRYALYAFAWFQWNCGIKSHYKVPLIPRISKDEMMGCFTMSPKVTQYLFDLDIPVWFLRSINLFKGTEVIQNVVSLVPPPRHLPIPDQHLEYIQKRLSGALSAVHLAGDPHLDWINRQSSVYIDIETRPFPQEILAQGSSHHGRGVQRTTQEKSSAGSKPCT